MSISQGFLAGRSVALQADAQKAGLLSALINRPTPHSRGAVRSAGGGGGSAIESFADQEARETAEATEAKKLEMAEEKHVYDMERSEAGTAVMEQATSERETEAAYKAEDRAAAEPGRRQAREIQQKAGEDVLAYQEQHRHYKAYEDAIYRGDATAADTHFLLMFQGMGGETGTATVRRQVRNEKGELQVKDDGSPVMADSPTKYGYRGKAMTKEEEDQQRVSAPKHFADERGHIFMKFRNEEAIPVGKGRLLQLRTAISQSAMRPVGGGTEGTSGGSGRRAASTKDATELALDKMKTSGSIFDYARTYADNKPAPRKEGVEYDPLNPPEKTAQEYKKDLDEGLRAIAGMTGAQRKEAGIHGGTGPLSKQAATKAVKDTRKWFTEHPEANLLQMYKRGSEIYGYPYSERFLKEFGPELMPEDAIFSSGSPREIPDFYHGKDNVLHVFYKDIGPDGMGIAIDKTLGRPTRWDKEVGGWKPVEEPVLKAYVNLLRAKINDGDKTAEKMLAVLEGPHMKPFSRKELAGDVALEPKAAISDTEQEADTRVKPANQMTTEELNEAMTDRTSPAERFLEEQRNLSPEEKEMIRMRKEEQDKKTFLRERPY